MCIQEIAEGPPKHTQYPEETLFYSNQRESILLTRSDIRGNLETIRKERSDEHGHELWFPMMLGFFNNCPYAESRGLKGEEDLIRHFIHQQALELRLCKEVFPDRSINLESKNYSEEDILNLP